MNVRDTEALTIDANMQAFSRMVAEYERDGQEGSKVAFSERHGDIIWFVLVDGTQGTFDLQTGNYGWRQR